MANEQAWATQLNSDKQQASTREKKEEKGGSTNLLEEKMDDVLQEPTRQALKYAWANIISTYGLTLFYVIFHFILKYIESPLSRFFARMGSEGLFGVMPPPPKTGIPGAEKATEITEKGAELAEQIVALTLTLILVVIILLIIVLIITIAWVATHPLDAYDVAVEIIQAAVESFF